MTEPSTLPNVPPPPPDWEQPELPFDDPKYAPYGFLVELRKGDLHDLHTERSVHADTLDGVANVVEGFRTHSVVSENVTWQSDRIVVGTCRGLAPKGVVWEIAVTPAVTLDA